MNPGLHPSPPVGWWERVGLLGILGGYAGLAWRLRAFFTDDASISLRYARHLAMGLGARWNPADPAPTEGYSNPALVFFEATWAALGGDPAHAASAQGLLFGLLAVLAAAWGARRLAGPAAGLVAAAVVALYAGVPFWSLGGLETTAALCLVTVGSLGYVTGASLRAVGLAFAILPWLRPEAAAYVLPLLLVGEGVAFHQARRAGGAHPILRRLVVGVGPFLLSTVVLSALRLAWFGHLLPNPVVVKVAAGEVGPATLRFLEDTWPVVVLAAVGLVRGPPPVRLLGVTLGTQLVMSLSFSDIVNNLSRLLLPTWGVWAAVGAAGLGHLAGARPLRWTLGGVAVVGLLAGVTSAEWPRAAAFVDRYRDCRITVREETAAWIRAHVPPEEVYAIADAGLVPYLAEGRALDIFGLSDPRVQETGPQSWKARAARILADEPAWIVLTSKELDHLDPRNRVEQKIQAHRDFARYTRVGEVDGMRCGYSLLVYRREAE